MAPSLFATGAGMLRMNDVTFDLSPYYAYTYIYYSEFYLFPQKQYA